MIAFSSATRGEGATVSGAGGSDAAVEAATEAGEAQATEASETPQPPAPVELTAQVREQGGRYGHRMPRRMRRKMRGGGGAGVDPRFEQERRGESAAPPSGAPAETRI